MHTVCNFDLERDIYDRETAETIMRILVAELDFRIQGLKNIKILMKVLMSDWGVMPEKQARMEPCAKAKDLLMSIEKELAEMRLTRA